MIIDRDGADALLSALDVAFQQGLGGRYGGGVLAVVQDADGTLAETVLRQAPPDVENVVVLGLTPRDSPAPTGTGLLGSGMPVVPVGTVDIRPAPQHGTAAVHVETELFDGHDPNGPADAGCFPNGLLVGRPDLRLAGSALYVLRSPADLAAAGLGAAQERRGWLPRQPRGRVNRGAGLGSNGFQRATPPLLTQPVARVLLDRIGERMATATGIGAMLARVTVGFRVGAPGAR